MAAPTVAGATSSKQASASALALTQANGGIPSSLADNDILVVAIQTANQAISTPTNTGGNSAWQNATWTEIDNQADTGLGTGGAAGANRLAVYWMRYTSAMTVGTLNVADSGDHQIATCVNVRGCITTGNPYDVAANVPSASGPYWGWSSYGDALSTTVNDTLVMAIFGIAIDSNSAQFASWYARHNVPNMALLGTGGEYNTNTGRGGTLIIATDTLSSAGQIVNGESTVDITITTNSSGVNGAMMLVAFKPNNPPTVALNTADAHNFGTDTTPTLEFTGTDADSDDIRYEIQVADSAVFGGSLMLFYPESNKSNDHSFGGAGFSQLGELFSFPSPQQLASCKFYLNKVTTPSGTMVAYLYAESGGIPTGSPLATSDTVDVTTIPSGYSLVEFVFSGANQYQMAANTTYVIVCEWLGDGSAFQIGNDLSGNFAGGYMVRYIGTWQTQTGHDLIFYLYCTTTNTPVLDEISGTDAGFLNTVNGSDTDPFTSGQKVSFTVQSGDELTSGTWYWRARGKDPTGSNTWGAWSTTRYFTVQESGLQEREVTTAGTSTAAANSGAEKKTEASTAATSATNVAGASFNKTDANTTGTSTATVQSTTIVGTVASAEGSCVAASDGLVIAATEGSVAGTSETSADTTAFQQRDVTTDGSSATDIVGRTIVLASADSQGTSTAQAEGEDANVSQIVEGDGSSVGTSTVSADASAIWNGGASATGTTTDEIVGCAIALSDTSTTGLATTSVAGVTISGRTLSLTNTSTVSSNSAWWFAASGDIPNTSTAQSDGRAIALTTADVTNTSTTQGDGIAVWDVSVSVDGSSTVTATTGADARVDASTAGTSVASAEGEDANSGFTEVTGSATGTSSVSADSGVTLTRAVTVDGSSTTAANSNPTITGVGSTTGTSTAQSPVNVLITAFWSSVGSGVAEGTSGAIAGSVGAALGTSVVDGQVGDAASGSEGQAVGTSTVNAISQVTAGVETNVVGASTVTANAIARVVVDGTTAGTSTVNGESAVLFAIATNVAGSSTASADVQFIWAIVAVVTGVADASAQSQVTAFVEFTVIGIAVASADGVSAGERILRFGSVVSKVTLRLGNVSPNVVFRITQQ